MAGAFRVDVEALADAVPGRGLAAARCLAGAAPDPRARVAAVRAWFAALPPEQARTVALHTERARLAELVAAQAVSGTTKRADATYTGPSVPIPPAGQQVPPTAPGLIRDAS